MVSDNFQGTYRLVICPCDVVPGLDLLKITVHETEGANAFVH